MKVLRSQRRAVVGTWMKRYAFVLQYLPNTWIISLSKQNLEPSAPPSSEHDQPETVIDVAKATVPVPTDAFLAASPCPICKEKFRSVWKEEVEEWVWQDAVRRGDKIYHATCLAEAGRVGDYEHKTRSSDNPRQSNPPLKRNAGDALLDNP